MTAYSDIQLRVAYEEEHMTPQQIADEEGWELGAVKSKLMQVSKKYRKDCGSESTEVVDGLNFTDDELRRVGVVIIDCALAATLPDGSPDYRTRLKAATYVRDDKKGRLEQVKAIQQTNTFNMVQFNDDIAKARQLADSARKQITDSKENTINV